MFGAFAVQHALDRANPERWRSAAFWGVLRGHVSCRLASAGHRERRARDRDGAARGHRRLAAAASSATAAGAARGERGAVRQLAVRAGAGHSGGRGARHAVAEIRDGRRQAAGRSEAGDADLARARRDLRARRRARAAAAAAGCAAARGAAADGRASAGRRCCRRCWRRSARCSRSRASATVVAGTGRRTTSR